MQDRNEDYKIELIKDLPDGEIISFYKQGDFVDLCAGPHMEKTSNIKAVKLTSVAGAYWRGNSDNKMLQRIYGTSFPSQQELDEYIGKMEEAKKRDHRKIGREMDLFAIFEEGPGFPFFLPKGMIIRNELEKFWREEHIKRGYEEIKTPIILNEQLCHRHELSGALHGLMRVRTFTQDDAHIFMTPEQIKDEVKKVISFIDYVYKIFGFKYHVELSTRPEEKFIGTLELWDKATNALRESMEEMGLDYVVNEGDGAFYGPKLDFHLEDSIGRTWQCGTVQLDYQMPERFDVTYVGADGEKHTPVMVHRVIFGSIERFIGILTEHYAGKFPLWLAPVQVKLLTVTEKFAPYAEKVAKELEGAGIRVELDVRNEKIGYKLREARNERVTYIGVIGQREEQSDTLSLRHNILGEIGELSIEEFKKKLLKEIEEKIQYETK